MLNRDFFDRDTLEVASDLIGRIIYRKFQGLWLSVRIIETEAYYMSEKASHSSLGYTEKRAALFMPPGTIYMYYARGADSLCVSTAGKGHAVLIKSGITHPVTLNKGPMIDMMLKLNPRDTDKLCSGQTLLCKSLSLKVKEWDKKAFDKELFYIDYGDDKAKRLIQTRRLGIREDRDAHLFYRFVEEKYSHRSTKNILTQKSKIPGIDYFFIEKK